MAKKVINVGLAANDGTGDSLRVAGGKINENFTEVYDALSTAYSYTLPKASASVLGGVKVGANLSINASTGVLSASVPNDLTDLNIVDGIVGQYLTTDGDGNFSFASLPSSISNLNDLGDVVLTGPTANQYLKYNGASWVNSTLALTTSLSGLTDVDLNGPTAGQVLKFDGTNWINDTDAGGSGNPFDQSLNTTDQVEFVKVTAEEVDLSGSGTPTVYSETDLYLSATGKISVVTKSQLTLGKFTSTEVTNLSNKAEGDIWYNTSTDTYQGYANGAVVSLSGGGGGSADLGNFKIEGNTLGTIDDDNTWGGSSMNISPNGEGNTWIYIPNDSAATSGASLVIGNTSNTGGGIQLVTDDGTWTFFNDGILQLPAGGDILDSDGNSVISGVVNPLYLMANVDGNISTSTDGTTWSSSIDIGINIGTVAVGPSKIVYTRSDVNQDANNTGLYSTSKPSIPPTLIEGTDGNPGGDLYWLNVEYFEGATYPWVAVGYQDSDLKLPTLLYSSDGISWDFATINLEGVYDATNLEFTDIAYGNGYYVITARSDTNISGGMWVTQDLTQTIAVSTNQLTGIDVNFKFIEYFAEQNGFHKWNAIATNNQWWATSDNNPAAYEEWSNLFETDGLAGMIEQETGLANVTIEEFASGQVDGYSYWMASSGSGHIVWWPNAPAGPFVSIPNPYTSTINDIIRGTTTRISFSALNNFTASGEKIVISGVTSEDASEPGTSDQSYNGTFYIKNNAGIYELYTDQALTTPWDTSTYWPVTDPTNGTLTWSHGTYIDSLGHANNAFYAANDDEEIFKGQFGEGLYWTKVDDKNNSLEYWNDFAYYPEFAYGTNNELTNGEQTLTLENDGTVTLPAGGTITEGVVTSNPTIQLTPANPTVPSQKLVIKGGGQYNVEDNGISLNWNVLNPEVGDTVYISVASIPNSNGTLYWWIHPTEANISNPDSGTLTVYEEGGTDGITFEVDNLDYEFTVRVSTTNNVYDPATIGVESYVFNQAAPIYGNHHLHLTTGDLAETSIFLGTDDQNVRTTPDGSIEITTPNTTNNVWQFSTDGSVTLPEVPWNYEARTFVEVPVTYGQATLTFTVLGNNTFSNMKVEDGSGGYGANNQQLTVLGTEFPGGTTPANDIIFNVTTFPVPDFPSEVTTSSIVTYVSGTLPARYDNIINPGSIGFSADGSKWVFGGNGTTTLPGTIKGEVVSNTYTDATIVLDVYATINKLTPISGIAQHYYLEDGVEGQIMYIALATGGEMNAEDTCMSFDHARWSNGLGNLTEDTGVTSWMPFRNSSGGSTILTLVFIDGHWNLPHNFFD
jgi:hypothetical protein